MPTSTSASAEASGNNVPAFLSKLWRLVEDPKYDSIISWSSSGQSFTIHDQTQFAKDVLPLYFKHNNMASFIRQLNMYGFRKVVNVDSGGLKGYKEDIEFYHNFFIRGQEETLEFIKRKAPGHQKLPSTNAPAAISAVPHEQELRTELVRELLTDVNQLQGKQVKVDTQLGDMKRENEALWREVAVLRRKHLKQQQIVEKLIHFLASLVHQARSANADNNISMKRKHTLMIDEGGKMRKTIIGPVQNSRQATPQETRISEIESGPIISDITNEAHRGSPRFGNQLSRGGKGTTLTISPSSTPAPDIVEELINSPDTSTGLNDEVVLCENLFDDEVDLAPAVKAASKGLFQVPQNVPQQNNQQQVQLQDFDLDQPLNTPQIEDWGEQSPLPGTSSKPVTDRTTSACANPGMELALQSPNLTAAKSQNSMASKSKDTLNEHLEGVETELDWLQDQLLAGGLNIDSNTLMNIFNTDLANLADDNNGANSNSQVVSYQSPSFLDMMSEPDEEDSLKQLKAK